MTRSDETREQTRQPKQEMPERRNNPFDPNDLSNYIREPGEFVQHHMRDPLPSEVAYRL